MRHDLLVEEMAHSLARRGWRGLSEKLECAVECSKAEIDGGLVS